MAACSCVLGPQVRLRRRRRSCRRSFVCTIKWSKCSLAQFSAVRLYKHDQACMCLRSHDSVNLAQARTTQREVLVLRQPHLLGPRGEGVRGQGQARRRRDSYPLLWSTCADHSGVRARFTILRFEFRSPRRQQGDLKTSAQVQFRFSAAGLRCPSFLASPPCLGPRQPMWSAEVLNHPLDELDASYCFLWGHCQNEEVTSSTTREEAIEMCCSPELSRASFCIGRTTVMFHCSSSGNRIFPEPKGWQSVGREVSWVVSEACAPVTGFGEAPTNLSMEVSPRHVDSQLL